MSWVSAFNPPAARPALSLADRQVRLLAGLLVADTVLQRLAIPGPVGQVPLVLPLGLAVLVLALRCGLLAVDPARLQLGLLAVAVTAGTTACSVLVSGPFSVPSYAYLLTTYLPFVLIVSGDTGAEVLPRLLHIFVRVAAVVAVLAIVQLALQPVGWHRPDVIGDLLPSTLVQEGYNTNNAFSYASPYYRTNGFVFLEPSFCSQFLGVAVLAQLWLRRGGRLLVLLLAAMLTTLTGTGFVVVAVGVAVAGLVGQGGLLARLGPGLLAGGVVAALTPVGTLLARRVTEGGGANSSTGQRFVLPFQLIVPGWLADLPHALLGAGPGSTTGLLSSVLPGVGVVPLAPLKLLYEYGVVGAVVFLVFLGWCVLPGTRAPSVSAGLVAAYSALSGSLQQPATVLVLWLLASACGARPGAAPARARRLSPPWARVGPPAVPARPLTARRQPRLLSRLAAGDVGARRAPGATKARAGW